MGYAVYEDRDARDRGVERWAGYGVPGICDFPGCENELPLGRGMGSKCERRYEYDSEVDEEIMSDGCGMYFCGEHLQVSCAHEHDGPDGIKPKPDTAEWVAHMLTDESWADWRDENPERVAAMRGSEGHDHG